MCTSGENMNQFLIRFLVFSSLWVMMLYQSSGQLIFSLFMLTASLTIFFFLSNENTSIYLYILLSILLLIHGLVIGEVFYTSVLLLTIVGIALFRFSKNVLYLFGAINLLFIIGLIVYQGKALLPVLVIGALFFLFMIQLNELVLERKDQQELYEGLLSEYRQLKRMHVSAEEMAKADERTRIAREIHDSVGHRLTALIMKLEMLSIQEPSEYLTELKEMANKSLLETREAVQTLQEIETKGIAAVVQLIRKLEAESQLLIEFTVKEGVLSIPLSNENGVVLYRVIQEALTNVMRHAISKQVHIVIGKSAIGSLAFTISNPIRTREKFTFGFGLNNMQARVTEVGGQLEVYQTEEDFVIQGMIPYE